MSGGRRLLPKGPSDWIAIIFMLIAIHLIGFYELLVILPYIDGDRTKTFWIHASMGIYLYVNIMMSLFFIIMVDTRTNRDGVIMPSILKPGWRFCSTCEANAPPRSYHCWSCDICILRRDHHCVFAGNCVGFANHRYFVSLMFLMAVSALYCNYLNMDYTFEMLHGMSLKAVFTMIMPLFSWLLGLIEAYSFLVAFVSALCLFGFLLASALFGYHFINLIHGQTTHEKAHHVKEFDRGWMQNLEDILGQRWYLTWLGPWVPSPLAGDGIEFQRRRGYENIKDI